MADEIPTTYPIPTITTNPKLIQELRNRGLAIAEPADIMGYTWAYERVGYWTAVGASGAGHDIHRSLDHALLWRDDDPDEIHAILGDRMRLFALVPVTSTPTTEGLHQ